MSLLQIEKDTRSKSEENSILDVESLMTCYKKSYQNPGRRVTPQGRPLSETYFADMR